MEVKLRSIELRFPKGMNMFTSENLNFWTVSDVNMTEKWKMKSSVDPFARCTIYFSSQNPFCRVHRFDTFQVQNTARIIKLLLNSLGQKDYFQTAVLCKILKFLCKFCKHQNKSRHQKKSGIEILEFVIVTNI